MNIKVTNNMQINYDAQGNMYKLPLSVINDPISYGNESHLIKKESKNVRKLRLKIRNLKDQKNKEIEISEDKSVKELKDLYLSKIGIGCSKIRLISKGKELIDDNQLFSYELENDIVILSQLIRNPD